MILVKHIPNWVPGIPFKKVLQKYSRAGEEMFEIPFSIVKVCSVYWPNILHWRMLI